MTDLNPRWLHVTMHENKLDTTCQPNNFHFYFYLFLYLFIIIYKFTDLFLSYYCLIIVIHSGPSYIFRAWLHEVIPNSNLYCNQLKMSPTKQVLKSHILCNYVPKENSNKAFPKSRCCSVIILSCFNNRTLWRRLLRMVYMLPQQSNSWFKWVEKASIEDWSHIFLCFLL